MKNLFAAAIVSVAFSPAFAGGTYDGAGVWTGTVNGQVHPIAEGHVIIETNNSYEKSELKDPENPMGGMTGRCFGSLEVVGANPSGAGSCVFSNGDGEMITVRWVANGFSAEGALTGHWGVTGGSGAMTGATGGGTFHSLSDDAAGTFANTLTGAITIP